MAKQKILLAEDDLGMREIMSNKLSKHGWDVVVAENGALALKLAREEKPDGILLDLMMPEMGGFEVLEAIRKDKDKKISGTKVIILSNLWDTEHITQARKLKADNFLVKAYQTPEEIVNKLESALEGKEAKY